MTAGGNLQRDESGKAVTLAREELTKPGVMSLGLRPKLPNRLITLKPRRFGLD